jgi:hypothetical protein
MANVVITGKAEQTDESSYIVQSTGEVVTKIQLTLKAPGMQDRALCEMPLNVSPKPDILEPWEMEERWLVVSANPMRGLGFTRSNARPGEEAVGALAIFQATDVREATADERWALLEARTVSKLQAKQRQAARQAARKAERKRSVRRQRRGQVRSNRRSSRTSHGRRPSLLSLRSGAGWPSGGMLLGTSGIRSPWAARCDGSAPFVAADQVRQSRTPAT